MALHILVASYTSSISTIEFDASKKTLTTVSSVEVGERPSWITPHPKEKSIIFAGLEQTEGSVVSVKYDAFDGAVVGKVTTGGQDPCSLLATEDELFVANYSSGSLSIFEISASQPYLRSGPAITQLEGKGPNADRQEGPHAHHVVLTDDGELLVADLGSDRVARFVKKNKEWVIEGFVNYAPGGGPRHVAIHDGYLYTLLELTSTLSKHRFPALPAEPTFLVEKPTMSNPPTPPHDMLAAELLIPKPNASFPTAYAYISNRNDPHPEGDTIAIFAVEGEGLELIAEVRTGLNHLRAIVFDLRARRRRQGVERGRGKW
uniref:Isomerase YbhE n=1 Tax=Mycena chlorophos TaxID=658473 RepID=A0ABQ0L6K6_MYCCL|nr:predicted protein [Mycena chlorophos]